MNQVFSFIIGRINPEGDLEWVKFVLRVCYIALGICVMLLIFLGLCMANVFNWWAEGHSGFLLSSFIAVVILMVIIGSIILSCRWFLKNKN